MRLLLVLALLGPVAGLWWLLEPVVPSIHGGPVLRPRGPRSDARLAPGANRRPNPVAVAGPGVSVGGRVVDAERRPVAGAVVRSLDDRGRLRDVTRTDAQGAFRLDDAFWDGPLRVDAGRCGRAVVYFEDEDRRSLRIGLHPAGVLRGRVLDPDGASPVPDARVVARDWQFGDVSTRTQADGSFEVAPVRADVAFELFADAGLHGRSRLLKIRCGAGTLDVRLEPVRLVEGTVVTPSSDGTVRPVSGIPVTCAERGDDIPDGEAVVTDEAGRFALPVLGFWGRLKVRSPDWYQPDPPPPLPRGSAATVVVMPRADLAGRCVREDGRPLAGVELWCDAAYVQGPWFSEADGAFRIPDVGVWSFKGTTLEARRGTLRAERAWSKQPEIGDDVVLVLRSTPSIRGRVVDEHGTPVVGAWACVTHGPEERYECEPTDAEGRFVAAGLEAGPCTVELEAGGFVSRTLAVQASPTGTALGVVRLERLSTCAGRVVDDDGWPIPGASIEVEHVGDRPIPVAPDGSFRIALPSNPSAMLRFLAPGHLEHAIRAREVPAGGPWTVTLSRLPALAGRVVDEGGCPLTTGQVVLRGPAREATYRARLDTDGRFAFEPETFGPFEFGLEAPDHELAEPRTVSAGQDALRVLARRKPVLAGRVLGPEGRGLGGVGVAVRDADTWRSDARRTWTRADGTFRLAGLSGTWFDVEAGRLPDGMVARTVRWVEGDTQDLVLRAEVAETIEGRLLGVVDGTPETFGVSIRTAEGKRCDRSMMLQPDGSFRITGLLPGVYELGGWTGRRRIREAVAGPVRVRAGATNVLLVPGPLRATEDDGE